MGTKVLQKAKGEADTLQHQYLEAVINEAQASNKKRN